MRIRDNFYVVISGYQDKPGLSKLLSQVTPHVKGVIYGDGRYDGFTLKSNKSPYSTDGSLELCAQYKNVHIVKFAGYQPEKRQTLVEKAASLKADCIFIIDTDEWLHPDYQDWDKFYDQLENEIETFGRFHRIWNTLIYVNSDYELAGNGVQRNTWSIGAGRIWYRPEELEYYAGVHYWVRQKGTTDPFQRLMSTDKTIKDGIRLYTSSSHRPPEFKKAREKWSDWGMDYENRLIANYSQSVAKGLTDDLRKFGMANRPQAYPLICILQDVNTKCSPREKGLVKHNSYADILFVRYEKPYKGLQEALNYFTKHRGYSHLVLTQFEINFSEEQYQKILSDVLHEDYTVLGGYTVKPLFQVYSPPGMPPAEPEVSFTLHNASQVKEGELHAKATIRDVQQYLHLYRQYVIPVSSIGDLALTFVRNDIVKFLGQIPESKGTLAEIFSKRVSELGIMQFVRLDCNMDKASLEPYEWRHNHGVELFTGKYK